MLGYSQPLTLYLFMEFYLILEKSYGKLIKEKGLWIESMILYTIINYFNHFSKKIEK